MKKLKLIYNPLSGDGSFADYIDECVAALQNGGYETHLFRCSGNHPIADHIAAMEPGYYDAVAVSGGDGTLNVVLNALLKHGHNLPLGIIPSGTANDFASYLKIPKDAEQAAAIIADGHTMAVDVGLANNNYFINVCGAGFLTNISQTIDGDIKNLLGKFAYYLKGIGQLPNFTPLKIRITSSAITMEDEIYLFLVLNSAGTGGFDKLVPFAAIDDGQFDFVAFKAMPLMDLAKMMLKLFSGEYLSDPNILYFRDSYIKVEPLFDNPTYLETDIDGEAGPYMPVEIKNIPKHIQVFIPR